MRRQVTCHLIGGGHYRIGRIWGVVGAVRTLTNMPPTAIRHASEMSTDPIHSCPRLSGDAFRVCLVPDVLSRFRLGEPFQVFCSLGDDNPAR